jgi:hypothetical protein
MSLHRLRLFMGRAKSTQLTRLRATPPALNRSVSRTAKARLFGDRLVDEGQGRARVESLALDFPAAEDVRGQGFIRQRRELP